MALFARVVRHGSFSEASRRCGVPVSTLSRKIRELEHDFGVRLLERTTKAVRATDVGEDLLPSCEAMLDAIEDARASIQQRRTEVEGTLRVATPPSLSDLLVVPLIHGFLQQYPKVSAKVLVTDRHLDPVKDQVDISLRVGPQADSSLIARPLIRYRHILVASPSYLARSRRPSTPADLKGHRLIGFSNWFVDATWKLSSGTKTARVPLNGLAINDYAGVMRAAAEGLGIAEMPSIICRREVRQRLLVPVMPRWQFDEVDLSAYYLSRRHPSRLMDLFLAHCSVNAGSCLDLSRTSGGSGPEHDRPRSAR